MKNKRPVARSAVAILLLSLIVASGCARQKSFPHPGENKYDGKHASVRNKTEAHRDISDTYDTEAPFTQPHVTVSQFVSRLKMEIVALQSAASMKREFRAFANKHELDPDDAALYTNYATVKVIFEATRDAGLWWIRWDITNREPISTNIWNQWKDAGRELQRPSAIAECDELSALFSFLAARLGVKTTGLFWPVWNHTISVWRVENAHGRTERIVIPTSHIFLDYEDGFDHIDNPEFNPYAAKALYDYTQRDVTSDFAIPMERANDFIMQIRKYGRASMETLHNLSYHRREFMEHPDSCRDIVNLVADEKRVLEEMNVPVPDIAVRQRFMDDLCP